jgi:hypothetical protein
VSTRSRAAAGAGGHTVPEMRERWPEGCRDGCYRGSVNPTQSWSTACPVLPIAINVSVGPAAWGTPFQILR